MFILKRIYAYVCVCVCSVVVCVSVSADSSGAAGLDFWPIVWFPHFFLQFPRASSEFGIFGFFCVFFFGFWRIVCPGQPGSQLTEFSLSLSLSPHSVCVCVRVATSAVLVALLLLLLLLVLLLVASSIVNNAAQSSYNCDTRRVKHVALTDNTHTLKICLITKLYILYGVNKIYLNS